MPLRSRRLAVVAVAITLALPVSRLAIAAVVDAVVHCCCGAHDADDPCGCPDCPSQDGERTPSETTAIGPCFQYGDPASVPALAALAVPALAALADPPPRGPVDARPWRPRPPAPRDVPVPPPRARS